MVKCLVGDKYLSKKYLEPLIENIKDEPMAYMESSELGAGELLFITSVNFFSDNRTTLVYNTSSLEKNDTLLELLEGDLPDTADLYILTDSIVKGRKLYNRLNTDKSIINFDVSDSVFNQLVNDECDVLGIPVDDGIIDVMKERCGFKTRQVVINALDIVGWVKQMGMGEVSLSIKNISVIPEYRNDNIWAMKDYLLKCNNAKVMEMADTIAATKNGNPIGMLSAIIGDIRIAYKLSFFPDKREEAYAALNTKRRTNKLCDMYSSEQLGLVLNYITDGIIKMKSGYEQNLELKVTLAKCLHALSEK